MRRTFFAALVLIAASIGVSGVALADTHNGTATPTPDTTATPEVGNVTADRVASLLEQPESWSQAQAREAYRFIRTEGFRALPADRSGGLAERIISRAQDENTTVPEDVRITAIQASVSEASTPAVTQTPAESAVVPPNGTVYANLGIVDLVSWDYDSEAGEMVLTFRAQAPTDVVITDALGPISNEGVSELSRREVTIRNERTVRIGVEEYRGAAAVSISTRQAAIAVSTGISAGNPWEGGSATVGWIGGASVAVLMFALAGGWKLRRESNTPRIAKRGLKRRDRE